MVLLTTHHEFIEVESEVADVGLALADGDGARRRRRRREVRRVLAVRPPARRCRSRNTQKNEQWTKGLTFKIGVGLSFLFDDIGELPVRRIYALLSILNGIAMSRAELQSTSECAVGSAAYSVCR